jgi:hypothetical protein
VCVMDRSSTTITIYAFPEGPASLVEVAEDSGLP